MSRPVLTPDQELARSARLERLADLDGRHEPGHPYASRYTGLAAPFTRLMGAEQKLVELASQLAELQQRIAQLEAQHGTDLDL